MIESLKEFNGGYCIKREIKKKPVSMLQTHYHSYYEIYYLVKGTVHYFIENMTFELSAGDMVLIPPNIIHRTVSTEDKPIERILLSFTNEFIEKDSDDAVLGCFNRYFIPGIDSFSNIFNMLENEDINSDNFSRDIVKCGIITLLVKISRSEKKDARLKNSSPLFQEIARYISDNYYSEITLDMLSKKFAISKSHLSRKFKTATGFNISEYILLVRVKNAQRLLTDTDYHITKVATMCGFNNSSYFSSVFKQFLGCTPKKFKKDLY